MQTKYTHITNDVAFILWFMNGIYQSNKTKIFMKIFDLDNIPKYQAVTVT